jgi:hypothetical protein
MVFLVRAWLEKIHAGAGSLLMDATEKGNPTIGHYCGNRVAREFLISLLLNLRQSVNVDGYFNR